MTVPEGMTVSEALAFLHPPIPRRTLERRLASCTPLPALRHRKRGRGRPAAVYKMEDVLRQHTEWAHSNIGKRPAQQNGAGGATVQPAVPALPDRGMPSPPADT